MWPGCRPLTGPGQRFLDAQQSAIILGPVGVDKTHMATALGYMAIRRRHGVLFARSDKLFTRRRAADSRTPSTPKTGA
nr:MULTISPECIES: ATP-binding protein [unclassified Rhodococcus (in: high G+C Gram-positive bacteria)]